ncbi:S-adenosyl-l-methionine hydroxide adenosyltransferase family protein [Hymenobacter sp. BT491]|uniref:SAM hydrolase/SAM-dependent halogenase family protein n=1 Tax=Hymenobacter sp. BT491 TaxID=2766779 RepID=UPI001653C33E|nr:SAM-dependent chlorinase/fluorinase [Hymenobacter sp. BT491]MBC6988585.1 SAM-dependent chlorinase/fluorinase [Hymenobacter sp. BT491]
MGLLTFLSDFGYRDHYVAAVKARILHLAPTQPVLDITHGIEPFNIAHAVHVLNAVFRDFPAGTVHLVGVNDLGGPRGAWHAALFEGHYFVAADNGILALLTDGQPEELVRLAATPTSSPTRDVLTPAAVYLAGGGALTDLGPPPTEYYQLMNRQLRLQDHRITGHVVHVDHYGNLITNITRASVEAVGHGRPCTIHFARETVREVAPHFQAADPGDAVCIFNSQNMLCIGVNQGNASELLGLHFDSQVDVRFPAESQA